MGMNDLPKLEVTLNWCHVIEGTTSTETYSKTDRQRRTDTLILVAAANHCGHVLSNFAVPRPGWLI